MSPKDHNPPPAVEGASIPAGIVLLGRGKAQGINYFSPGVQPFLSALAPTIAMALISLFFSLNMPAGQKAIGVVRSLVPIVFTLSQLVISEVYAAYLNRKGLWLRYATASLWCDWLPLIVMIFAEGALRMVMPNGTSMAPVLVGIAVGVSLYSLWLSWYISRVGLIITGLQAALMTLIQIIPVGIIGVILWFLPPHYNVLQDILGLSSH
ncbi:hypothetical protein [Swingsia samuiensis]|uniref:Yip1 domain-containing protein n=1 Tax=Swingsia samuiensis TaxID=1293412 RepID=A0A4Y6ULK9_9PROT|nr:hypothetical protein [Swingsia samuiensis]QDH17538.1 hypothetical protein E3D00_08170 [Swingsia samuiensis]